MHKLCSRDLRGKHRLHELCDVPRGQLLSVRGSSMYVLRGWHLSGEQRRFDLFELCIGDLCDDYGVSFSIQLR